MIKAFKSHNSKWIATTAIVTDKDFNKLNVFKKEFPNASLVICLFHMLQNFRREITCDNLGLRQGDCDHALELMSHLAYSSSEEKYVEHYKLLKSSGLKSVIQYYDTNWHTIHHQWVEAFKRHTFTLNIRTNNHLKSINAKVKSVCSKYASLSAFFDQFLSLLKCLLNEKDRFTLMALAKKSVSTLEVDSPELKHSLLMPLSMYKSSHLCVIKSAYKQLQVMPGSHCGFI